MEIWSAIVLFLLAAGAWWIISSVWKSAKDATIDNGNQSPPPDRTTVASPTPITQVPRPPVAQNTPPTPSPQPAAPSPVPARAPPTATKSSTPAADLEDSDEEPVAPENTPIAKGNQRYVYSEGGYRRELKDAIARGGTSEIFRIKGRTDLVAKIYNAEYLDEFGELVLAKLKRQIAMVGRLDCIDSLAWPRTVLRDSSNRFVGYSMRRVRGESLLHLAHPSLRISTLPDADRLVLVNCGIELCKIISALHREAVFIGDFNITNFLFEGADPLRVSLVDTDGFQVRGCPCLFVKPEYQAPEHFDKDPESIKRTTKSDAYSFAVLLFQLLMNGRLPFEQVGSGDMIADLRAGRFPYGQRGSKAGVTGSIPVGPWYEIWTHLPYKLKTAFIATFRSSVSKASDRPTIQDWQSLLLSYSRGLMRGVHERQISPGHIKTRRIRRKEEGQ